ncbi:MAG TPA: cobaltochelatase subunit CobN [Bryobacteraceae bacterium]
MPETYRQKVVRADGRTVNIPQRRAHLSYCYSGCCCGRTERGYAAVPVDTYKDEWIGRKLRNLVHLTKGGCLGPCVLANVASLVFDGRAIWFHSVNSPWQVRLIFDYIESMVKADRFLQPPQELGEYAFNYYDWDVRPVVARTQPGSENTKPLEGVALLSHADTDLLTIQRVRQELPPELTVTCLSLNSIRTEEQMTLLLEGDLAQSHIVVLRLHGPTKTVFGFEALQRHCFENSKHLVIVSGTGEMSPELMHAGNVPRDVLETVTGYLGLGGPRNVAECLKFLSDRLLLTGHGYDPPAQMPEHGIYLPELETPTMEDWTRQADPAKPTAAVLFYRAHMLSGNTAFIDAIAGALEAKGLNSLCIFTSSLKVLDGDVPAALRLLAGRADVLVCTLSFALGDVGVLKKLDIPVLQAIAAGMPQGAWEVSRRGLSALETAINVALPEFDGRIISVPISFKERSSANPETLYAAHPERVDRLAGIAARLARLRALANSDKRIAFVLTNSSAKASQVGNAVGLDTPASLLNLLRGMKTRGYRIAQLPESSDAFMQDLLSRGTYDETHPLDPKRASCFDRPTYKQAFQSFPDTARLKMEECWGTPADQGYSIRANKSKSDKKLIGGMLLQLGARVTEEPFSDESSYHFAAMELGNALVALQPPRGYGMNPDAIYHTPDLPPTHHYTAFYRWLGAPLDQGGWGADAIVHVGKHGTLEWLPGKGIGLSGECFPDILLEDLPLIYPFIINDPGEGSQAKRRAHAVVVDHLTPPMTNAETYGALAQINQLVNEYYALEKLDPSKLPFLQQQIWDLIQDTNLKADLDLKGMLSRDHGDHKHDWDDELTPEGIPVSLSEMSGNDVAHLLEDIDGYLCELGMAQIRDGLHVLGEMPPLPDMLRALTRLSNAGVPGLQESLLQAFGYDLTELLAQPGVKLEAPTEIVGIVCRSHADVLEAVETLSSDLYRLLEETGFQLSAISDVQNAVLRCVFDDVSKVLEFACRQLVPNLERVDEEIANVLNALEGRYVPAGPSGAPTRGMAHILPTGRNFFAVDPRALPSQAAWRVGQQLAHEAIERYRKEENCYPEMVGLSAWGTSQMRTHGDDIAEAFALLGVEPVWSSQSRRMEGVAMIPLERLGRPRVDVTLRISGFFRDAFPHLIDLFDDAVLLVVNADETPEMNFPRKHYLADLAKNQDLPIEDAESQARYRVFGAKPGSYGAGIQALMETGHWQTDQDLAHVFLEWGGYAYAKDANGVDARGVFADRLKTVQVALHNQDNREHDIFDSDDYYQFQGGMVATIRALTGAQPKAYFGDSSRPDQARVRDLREEALRVYRSRVVNPKWIESIKRHGYKGGLELVATVDYIFGFDATAQIAPDFVYEGLAEQYALDPAMREFYAKSNPWALNSIAERLLEAARRELWEQPKPETLDALRQVLLESETVLEAMGE